MENIFLTNKESDKELYQKIISQTSEAILNTFDSDKAYSGPTPEELKSIIHQASILPEKGLGWEKALELTKEKILPNLLKPSSTDYMAHLHGSSLLETIAAELIISTFNQSMDSWDQSPVATEIEVEVINHLCKLYGYDDNSDGVFTSGGSQSNQTAIILARDSFCNKELNYDIKKYGVNEKCLKLRMYTSEISHFSMEKSAHILGMGYQSVVKVPVDKNKRMDISLLEKLMRLTTFPWKCSREVLPPCSVRPVAERPRFFVLFPASLNLPAALSKSTELTKKESRRISAKWVWFFRITLFFRIFR